MTLGQIRADIYSNIGNNPYVTPTDLNTWANEGVMKMARFTKPFSNHFNFLTVAGCREYNLPSNLMDLKNPVTYQGNLLTKITLQEAQALYSNWWGVYAPNTTLMDVPDRYYIRFVQPQSQAGQTNPPAAGSATTQFLDTDYNGAGPMVMGMYPTPNDAQVVDFFGDFCPALLLLDTDNPTYPIQWHDVVRDYGLWRAHLKLAGLSGNLTMANKFESLFNEGLALFEHLVTHQEIETIQTGMPDLSI